MNTKPINPITWHIHLAGLSIVAALLSIFIIIITGAYPLLFGTGCFVLAAALNAWYVAALNKMHQNEHNKSTETE